MKNIKLLCGLMLLAGVSISGAALADRGHGHSHVGVDFVFGVPYSYPYYPYYPAPYYYPYAYYPPVMAAPAQPPVYIEQGSVQPAPQQSPATPENYYWYHCDKPDGYYPYIKECLGGWQKVIPTPPPQQ
jgi:hypothetical protein